MHAIPVPGLTSNTAFADKFGNRRQRAADRQCFLHGDNATRKVLVAMREPIRDQARITCMLMPPEFLLPRSSRAWFIFRFCWNVRLDPVSMT